MKQIDPNEEKKIRPSIVSSKKSQVCSYSKKGRDRSKNGKQSSVLSLVPSFNIQSFTRDSSVLYGLGFIFLTAFLGKVHLGGY